MNPFADPALARLRHAELLAAADRYRLAAAVRPPRPLRARWRPPPRTAVVTPSGRRATARA